MLKDKNNILFSIITYHPNPHQLNKLLAVLKPYKTLIIDNTKNNLGYAGGSNKSIKEGLKQNADWIVILNQDLTITSSFLKKFVSLLNMSKPGIVGPFWGTLDKKRWTTILKENPKFEALNSKQILNYKFQNKKGFCDLNFAHWNLFRISNLGFRISAYISGSFIAIHKNVIKKIGDFYQPYFMYYEDADLCIRAQKAGFPIMPVKIPGISHRDAAPSFLHEYYLARNHLLFVERCAPIYIKFRELLHLPLSIYRHYQNKNTGALAGIKDFLIGKYGKSPFA